MDVRLESAIDLTDISSPSHDEQFEIARHTPSFCQASLETSGGGLDDDVVLSYRLERPRTGLDLITSRKGGQDGFFMLTLTSGPELSVREAGMDYLFLLDISGSMAHDGKLLLSKNSVGAFINQLDGEDRFEVMTFNVRPVTLFGQLTAGDGANKVRAEEFMQSQRAKGGTVLAPAMTGAYRYATPDRILNVVILSDGMTEQKERRELLELIQSRPANTRVFCIGVGNEVNRPLLGQLAEDSGGLAAFISRGDNFERQAKAFRRKLMRPVATDLSLDFKGVQVYDVEPRQLPNLFHGGPIRVYGRYKGEGLADVTLRGNIQGVALEQSVALEFPGRDDANPEIERMWALKRVAGVQKDINRKGTSQAMVDEIIRLGEGFSIVTEYTSFLVLENDAEYQRWKIERRNLDRMARDRRAQTARDEALAALRDKALAQLGPQPDRPVKPAKVKAPQGKPGPQVSSATPQTAPQVAQPRNGQSRDFSFGSGPVGPLFVGMAYWLARRRKKQ
jgi:Ca-activated chloride channel family protein